MITIRIRRIGLALGLLALATCSAAVTGCEKDKGGEAAEADKVDWPEKPADGTPVVVEFLELTGEGDELAGKARVFNFSDRTVRRLSMTLHYLDADGNELKDFPWGQVGSIDAGEHDDIEVGAFMPPETTSIRTVVHKVEFSEGEAWEAPQPAAE